MTWQISKSAVGWSEHLDSTLLWMRLIRNMVLRVLVLQKSSQGKTRWIYKGKRVGSKHRIVSFSGIRTLNAWIAAQRYNHCTTKLLVTIEANLRITYLFWLASRIRIKSSITYPKHSQMHFLTGTLANCILHIWWSS